MKDKICVIGDGKANSINGLLDSITKIYSINLPQVLLRIILFSAFEHIDDNLIQIVEKKKDLTIKTRKYF